MSSQIEGTSVPGGHTGLQAIFRAVPILSRPMRWRIAELMCSMGDAWLNPRGVLRRVVLARRWA